MNELRFKVYNAGGFLIASCKFMEDAAALVALHGEGATIRVGRGQRSIVWTEGAEEQSAGESYDYVADVITERVGR